MYSYVSSRQYRFSELFETAVSDGPQVVTHHGKAIVKSFALSPREIYVAEDDFFLHLMNTPKVGDLQLPTRKSRKRPAELGV